MRSLLIALVLFTSQVTAWGAYPYDSVAEIAAPSGDGGFSGGSATLIAVSENHALLLTCWHVVERAGNTIDVNWAATGEIGQGTVLRVDSEQDIALCVCNRPKGLRPVPVTEPDKIKSGRLTNAGFPGLSGILEWQTGEIVSITDMRLFYTCRPVPGMSGGATFDKYGNLVGVITHYQLDGGISASGNRMMRFIRDTLRGKSGWKREPAQFVAEIAQADGVKKNEAPQDSFAEFEWHVWLNYTGLYPNPQTSPLIDELRARREEEEKLKLNEQEIEKITPEKTHKHNYQPKKKRKRLFRRRT